MSAGTRPSATGISTINDHSSLLIVRRRSALERPVWRAPLVGVALAIAAACTDDPAAPEDLNPDHGLASAISGDAQISTIGSEAPAPLRVRLTSQHGRPLVNVPLTWTGEAGSRFDPGTSVTDDSGYARTWWTLGYRSGTQTALAIAGSRQVRFTATAADSIAFGIARPMALATFDGSGEVVHPDLVRLPRGWSTGRRLLAITPYPNGDTRKELPSLYASGDLAVWAGATTNPVVQPEGGYLSDPDILFEPVTQQAWLYYRQVTHQNRILLTTSVDGVHWSAPRVVLTAPNHQLISPSIVRVAEHDWHMWTVDAGLPGCSAEATIVTHRASADGIAWSAPDTMGFGTDGLTPWHLDVTWIAERHEFWALFNAKPRYHCVTPALYLATSPDGVHWTTRPSPVLNAGVLPQFTDIVYRSTLEYLPFADVVTIWYSGARYNGIRWVWGAAVERVRRADLFARTGAQAAWQPRPMWRVVPKLLDAP